MNEVKILDHGYLRLVESWGSDESIIEAARMSTGKGFLGWEPEHTPQCEKFRREESDLAAVRGGCTCPGGKPVHPGDAKLLAYLWKNKHSTPFEFPGATFEVKAPLFVFREWQRHRVPFGYSEVSARYAPLPDENYLPGVARMLDASKTNRQAGSMAGAAELNADTAREAQHDIRRVYNIIEHTYQTLLEEGVPKEIARVVLPVGRYSTMRATGNLRGWLGFLTLRMASTAQFEIRQYANALHGMLSEKFPRTLSLFEVPK